jgi:hypothetical protein
MTKNRYVVVTGFANPFFQSNTRMPSERIQDAWTTDVRAEADRIANALNGRNLNQWMPIYRVETVSSFSE